MRQTARDSGSSSAVYERRTCAVAESRSSASRRETSRPCSDTRRASAPSQSELDGADAPRADDAQLDCAPAARGFSQAATTRTHQSARLAQLRPGRIISIVRSSRYSLPSCSDDRGVSATLDLRAQHQSQYLQYSLRRLARETSCEMPRRERRVRHAKLDTVPAMQRQGNLG